jgi:transporter family protein
MDSNYQLFLFSGLAIIMWGLWGFFGKLALEKEMTPTTLFLAEVFMSVVFSIPILVMSLRKNDSYLPHVSWNIFGLISGAGLALGLLFYYMALEKGQVSIVVPLTAIYPIVSVFLGSVILKEKPSPLQWVGVFLVILGSVLLLSGPLGKVSQIE